jgi:hypothetical protein
MIVLVILAAIFIVGFFLQDNDKCENCGSSNLVESENYKVSHEETYRYCAVCGHIQD